ncbi:MAG TPA: hypothetical protein VFV31_13295 [Chitinophagaceae bacterium]|nr:hypothetical protein [Chitinophagaceae bacterium]
MKYVYTLLFTSISLFSSAQFYMNAGYSLSMPQQEMKQNIKPLHSLALSGLYKLPGSLDRVMIGADFAWGIYSSARKRQTFSFPNGDITETDVFYNSLVVQGGLQARVNLLRNKPVTPFVNGKAGYASFYSNIFIENPHDPDGCAPLDQRNIIKDGTIYNAYGGGLQIDWGVFSKRSRRNAGWIDISVNSIRGGTLNYINTKKLIDANNPPVNSDGKPLNVTFINASTQQLHQHQVAEVYTSPLRMLEFRISATFPLN